MKKDPKGQGKGQGRDAVNFMYHNNSGEGYIIMAEGTTPPRHYDDKLYVVLTPDSFGVLQLFLSKNGVVLIYDDIPARCLKFMDQLPTISANVMRPGRGHILPLSVTEDVTWERAKIEKVFGFTPGGDIPDQVRTTAWEFMGQATPENYVKLIFGNPLSTEETFDPKEESVMNILAEGSLQRERNLKMLTCKEALHRERNLQEALHRERNLILQEEALHRERHLSRMILNRPTHNYDNWLETPEEPSADQLQAQREAAIDEEAAMKRQSSRRRLSGGQQISLKMK